MTSKRCLPLAVTAAMVLLPAAGLAQTPPQSKPSVAPKADQVDPSACANPGAGATVGQGGDVEQKPGEKRSNGGTNLSDKLANSNGVICPPTQVDPGMAAPTPPGGTMPVIPPPGSPGGNQNVQPK